MKEIFIVSFVSEANCFFYLNERNLGKFRRNGELTGNCIKIEFGLNFNDCTYSSLGSRSNDKIGDDRIGLSALNAELLGIREDDEVLISITNAPLLSHVHVRPQNDEHYDLIMKNGTLLENSLLNQVSVVAVGKTIPIQVVSNIVINLKVEKLYPESPYGQLQQRTDLHILAPSEMEEIYNTMGSSSADDDTSNVKNVLKTQFVKLFNLFFQKEKKNQKSDFHQCSPTKHVNFVNHALTKLPQLFQKSDSSCNELGKYLSKSSDGDKSKRYRIVPLRFAPEEIQEVTGKKIAFAYGLPRPSTADDGSSSFKIFCRITKEEDLTENNVPFYNQFKIIPDSVLMDVVCFTNSNHQSSDLLYVSDYYMNLLNVKLGCGVRVEEAGSGEDLGIDYELICPLYSGDTDEGVLCFPEEILKIYKNTLVTVMDNIRVNEKINTLITGSTGSGKTYMMNALAQCFARWRLHYVKVDCKIMRKLKISSLEKHLTEKLSECCKHRPSVMILDDLDALAMDDEEGNVYGSLYSARVGDLIIDLITSYQSINEITFIATGSSLSKFKDMSTDRGPIIFENIHEIGELTSSERCFFLKSFVDLFRSGIQIEESVLEVIGNKTKGYNFQDLIDLLKIAQFKSLSRSGSANGGEITEEDFDLALAEKVPLSLYGVNLQKKTLTKFDDIGGMEESKNLLKEMYEWPLQYQELYKSCPLRLQCGVLLYGAPGTGKTLIAGAVANEFGLNFISIKGPEVFSKYVGASEQGVRDLFTRARKAKPCLLFFDEFDSLARRRGSSNEDVNDRVVNQLLTELDGVEELTGVFILAATSRPDLLDPALLRPGRIDRIVHCKLPTQVERLSILKALSKSMKLSDDVNLEEIAAKTDGYSGADLRAVLYAAQATLIKEIAKLKDTKSNVEILLKQSNLLGGLAETKPSISKEDRESYSASYEAFIESRTGRSHQRSDGKFQQRIMFA